MRIILIRQAAPVACIDSLHCHAAAVATVVAAAAIVVAISVIIYYAVISNIVITCIAIVIVIVIVLVYVIIIIVVHVVIIIAVIINIVIDYLRSEINLRSEITDSRSHLSYLRRIVTSTTASWAHVKCSRALDIIKVFRLGQNRHDQHVKTTLSKQIFIY